MPRTQKATTPTSAAKTPRAGTPKRSSGTKHPRNAFLESQRQALIDERASYTRQAEELKAEADSLALEHEPGDVQFDEEGGEGGTSNVDREMDLILSAQARAAVADTRQPRPSRSRTPSPAATATKSGGLSSD